MNRQTLAIMAGLGALAYSASQGAGTPPAKRLDLHQAIWPAPVAPPAAIAPLPPIVLPAPVTPPPITRMPPVIIPPLVTPRPIVKEARRERPQATKQKAPKQKTPEAETSEWLPPCSMVCWYAAGKTRAQLEAEAALRNPTLRMRRHALACLAGCSRK